jgi:hypothetical protein
MKTRTLECIAAMAAKPVVGRRCGAPGWALMLAGVAGVAAVVCRRPRIQDQLLWK